MKTTDRQKRPSSSFCHASSAARGQEICDLKVRDIHFNDKGAILDLTGKGEKSEESLFQVTVPIY